MSKKSKKISPNKKDKLMRLSAVSLSVIATTAIVASATYAYQGDQSDSRKFGPRFNHENQEAVQTALENNDYVSWSELMDGKWPAEYITEENFSDFVEMHKLMQAGDFAGAEEIREDLGLPEKGERKQSRYGCEQVPKHNWQAMEDAREALESNNYEAWLEAVGDNPIAEKITADSFSQLVEAHELMQAGDFTGAKEIRDELGLRGGPGKGMGPGGEK